MVALIALPLIAGPTGASASCRGRANTGTALGAVGGALLGNSISRGGGGAVIGGIGGAVVGHQIAKSGCGSSYTRHSSYQRSHTRYASSRDGRSSGHVYYDERGNPIRR
ncbi:hypothetical protein DJ021_08675 [Phenylobacterium hankyongense]|uniref:Uncharacterized protein n=2 Tax=Phenylobacterium hankyongense TaxID=1813876 RepID=A0A328B5A2_9CAUL|nr:hypothetical protein DJ021_08675 [Phenylobacterium hankyongense]